MAKLTENVTVTADASFKGFFEKVTNANIIGVKGQHPAGNVGVQIHHLDPINAGESVWVVNPEDVVNIGSLFTTGEFQRNAP